MGTMATTPVTNLLVVCGQWTWIAGSDLVGGAATYGSLGSAAPGNTPGARDGSISWTDASGKLWLFGGVSGSSYYNDRWSYDPTSNEWTWMSGAATGNGSGVYGSQGVAAAGNTPGARTLATASIDSSGNLWLFGGQGYDSAGTNGSLNDLWKFNISQNKWTWVSGANTAWPSGSTAPANAPGGRSGASGWIDGSGNLWLFGGMGTQGLTNDLWEFVPGMAQWSLISGSQTPNANGVYGVQNTAAATNLPGSRTQAAASFDSAGNLWLFGGSGYGAIGSAGVLSDLWMFSPTAAQWTWVGGFNTINAAGNYGTTSTTAVRIPGARFGAAAATDASGNFWLFGGTGYDSAGKSGPLNDAWEYQAAAKQWFWISGSQRNGAAGVYGTLGMGAATDSPGGRSAGVAWIDASGNFWLFGGEGLDSAKASGPLNDLWEFTP
jgi:N-acetylneuraminic acid mutarotase